MSYETDYSPIDYLKRRLRYYKRNVSKWSHRAKKEEWATRKGDIGRAIENWKLRVEQFEKAINKLSK